VIYYFYNDSAPVFSLTVFGKTDKEDLTSDQKALFIKIIQMIKSECKKRFKI